VKIRPRTIQPDVAILQQLRLHPGLTIRAEADQPASDWRALANASSSRKGAWVEAILEARAIALDFIPCRPTGVPAPYDFILERHGLMFRVQVKSAWKDKGGGSFVFHTTGGSNTPGRYTAETVDLLACFVVPLNVWYIVPIAEIEPQQEHLIVTPDAKSHDRRGRRKPPRHTRSYEAWKERWDLLG
jgi:hypothetical protein